MEVEWIATDPGSGLLSHSEQRSSVRDYVARIEELLVLGEGYSQVHRAGQDYPLLALSFKRGCGVVHQFSADHVFLLARGNALDADQTVLVPVLDDDVAFTGGYVVSAERAWAAVREFLRHGSAEHLGEWQQM